MKNFAYIALLALLVPLAAFAQTERSYHYTSIKADYDVRQDSTVAVKETQTYEYVGAYHAGWRSIPHDKITAITDVAVADGETGAPLAYSSQRLDKLDPASWGTYTVFYEDGATNIEWYYNLADTRHSFVLSYVVHGAVAFYKDHDELYWNIFTDYDVPVDLVEATVHVPGSVVEPQSTLYITGWHEHEARMQDDSTFYFAAKNIAPQEAVTLAAGWQKGLVDQGAYWRDLVRLYWRVFAALALLALSIAFSIGYRVYLARKYHGRGTIVPQYEPPQHLPPAMAEVIAKSHITDKAWPATIVDLAVRGYLSIEEKEEKTLFFFKTKNYVLTKTDEPDEELEEYERRYMDAVFADGPTFSTADIKKSIVRQSELSSEITKITTALYKETEADTHAFAIAPGQGPISKWYGAFFMRIAIFAGIVFLFASAQFFAAVICVIAAGIIWYALEVRPALNTKGKILKEEWLGFKMFLEVTGRDRMQNLTPDIFEKYLPYAMIFGVEKQWAKKFEAMHLPPPQWYHGAYVSSAGTSGRSFSPSSFASGFSASFASSFASSGGGGASGGGGGAGGGGGGGGGGAS